ncbi:nitrite/sulfite reductase [Rhodocyclus tenuis]|uniref:nitrite/sulfite reductase n=1 Tax=Rhodocyclus gracilis TaxID=2929842 RepID=UPI0012989617|nr:nitrite/sulfite reductase [Rhodocyclus gracilis]MRD73823.1 nitrite/sulfite reductase [Rhodocyclus gracilis]
MYRYTPTDQRLVDQRASQFSDQMARHARGELAADELRPLRLQNGLYIQRHGPMLRIAIPYGALAATQLRKLADITRRYDRGYGHFTTRQNLQLNWPKFEETPRILGELAGVQMHAIQTSGNCIRNVTTDHFAGVAPDELSDPRPYCEILRQWSTLHPEFAFLPRKFKIAVNAATTDRVLIRAHDIGLQLVRDDAGAFGPAGDYGLRVFVGGGLGRTPILGQLLQEFLPRRHLLSFLDAVLRVYNRHGRRDNLYKARIKILVQSLGVDEFRRQVEAEWALYRDGPLTITDAEFARMEAQFAPPAYRPAETSAVSGEAAAPATTAGNAETEERAEFVRWQERCVHPHKVAGYAAVTLSLKKTGVAPGDISAEQMDLVADLAEQYSFGELRVSHEQNLVLADVHHSDLYALWQRARAAGLATANTGLITDIICCPGGDLCSLANARSVPVAQAIQLRFADPQRLHALGEVSLNVSGCMNSCSHHPVADIGVLGVDKNGEEWYQITLGGRTGHDAAIGSVIGPAFRADEVPDVVDTLIAVHQENAAGGERFADTLARLGAAPYRERAYAGRGRHPRQERNTADDADHS